MPEAYKWSICKILLCVTRVYPACQSKQSPSPGVDPPAKAPPAPPGIVPPAKAPPTPPGITPSASANNPLSPGIDLLAGATFAIARAAAVYIAVSAAFLIAADKVGVLF